MLEIWKPVTGYEGLYLVSNQGAVKSLPRKTTAGKLLKRGLFSGGRWGVVLCKNNIRKPRLVAHLVAEAFLGPSNGLHVLHKNDVTTDDRVENLYYGTHAQNMQDKVKNGLSHRGSTHHKAKLTEAQVLVIKQRLKAGENHHALAAEYGVTPNTMQAIKHGTNWGWLDGV